MTIEFVVSKITFIYERLPLSFLVPVYKNESNVWTVFSKKGESDFDRSAGVRSVNSILIIPNFVTNGNFMQSFEEYVNICCDLNWLQFLLSTIIFLKWKSHSSGPAAVGAHVSLAGEVSAWVSSYEGEDPAWILPKGVVRRGALGYPAISTGPHYVIS